VIESFPLAQKDVASVFTLPKTIYGRQGIISEMTYIIQRVAGVYKSIRNRREKSYSTGSIMPTTASENFHASSTSMSDDMSDRLSSHEISSATGIGTASKSNASPSYCSGFDGSDTSVNGVNQKRKQGVEIVSVSGPGGVGKSTIFNAVQNVARQHG
jgi:ABC-type glutathione transport system ATPase component